jgi:hypothetical protein
MKTLAQVEARAPVDSINTPGDAFTTFIISAPGSYYLTGNVMVTNDTGIAVTTGGVTLDLNGFEISGGGNGEGIRFDADRATVMNGFIRDFEFGVNANLADSLHLSGVTFSAISSNAISARSESIISDCIVKNAGGIGINAGIVAQIRNCTIRTTGSHGIQVGETSIVEGNLLNDNVGDGIRANLRCMIRNNMIDYPPNSGAGIHLTSIQGECRVENNVVERRAVGIQADGPDNYIAGNTVRTNPTNYVFASGSHLNLLLSEIPERIDWPAKVKLAGSLSGAAGTNAITVTADNVTIDLDGHTLTGAPGSRNGVEVIGPVSSVEIRNGIIEQFGIQGVRAASSSSSGIRCSGLSVNSCGNSGIVLVGNGNLVQSCTTRTNGNDGIFVGSGSIVEGNVSSHNAGDGISESGGGFLVKNNTVYSNAENGIIVSPDGSAVVGNTVRLNGKNGIQASAEGLGNSLIDQNLAVDNNQSLGGFANIEPCAGCTFGLNHAP